MDHIEAIAIAIEALGFNIGAGLERRAKASFVEQALTLSDFVIVPKVSVEADIAKIRQDVEEKSQRIREGARPTKNKFHL